MRFKFTLSHFVLGSLEIAEPIGWLACKLKLERHEEYHSLIEYFDGDFTFYGDNGVQNGGIDFIREVENIYGADAELIITVELAPDDITYQTVFIGQIDLWNIEEMPDNKAQIPIIRNDFWAKFINRLDTQVNIQSATTLDNEVAAQFDSVNLRLLSQKIQKTSEYEGNITSFTEFTGPITYALPDGMAIDASGASDDYTVYSQATLDLIQDEITESYTPLFEFVSGTVSIFNNIDLTDEGGEIHVEVPNIRLQLGVSGAIFANSIESDPSVIDEIVIFVSLLAKKNDESPVVLATAGSSTPTIPTPTITPVLFERFFAVMNLSGQTDFTCLPSDTVSVYLKYEIFFNIDVGTDTGSIIWSSRNFNLTIFESDVVFTLQSIYPDSNAQGFFLHDAAAYILDRHISQPGCFYSEFLGSSQTIYRQYDADGCGWPYVLLKGLQLRRYSLLEKPFFLSFKQWWEGANPILNLGLTYETINGIEVIRVEEKRTFYDTDVSVNINNVRDIVRKYDDTRIFKTVKAGYKKWQSEDISGIDDPQTKHTYATILKKAGKEITIESDFIAASLAIETTRRKTREKSADYKFDNDTFIISIRPFPVDISPETDPDVTDYEPELDENFDSITNLLNPETRYNISLTPARNILKWIDWLSGGLQAYPDTAFKFTAGEGNYDMTSDMANASDGCVQDRSDLSEKEDIPVSGDPFHLALLYEISCPLDWDDYVLMRDNRKKAIGISQTTENHVKFFIKDLEYEIVKGTVKILAWPEELMTIDVIETSTQMLICEPAVPCQDAYLTEDNFEYITESGDCLVLN